MSTNGTYGIKKQKKSKAAVCPNRPNSHGQKIMLVHDSYRVHKAQRVKKVMNECEFVPYSPDLAPRDYYSFPKLRKYLRGGVFPLIRN